MWLLFAEEVQLESVVLRKLNDTHFLMAVEVAWEVNDSEVDKIENLELQWTVNGSTSEGDFLVWFCSPFLMTDSEGSMPTVFELHASSRKK